MPEQGKKNTVCKPSFVFVKKRKSWPISTALRTSANKAGEPRMAGPPKVVQAVSAMQAIQESGRCSTAQKHVKEHTHTHTHTHTPDLRKGAWCIPVENGRGQRQQSACTPRSALPGEGTTLQRRTRSKRSTKAKGSQREQGHGPGALNGERERDVERRT